MLNISDIDKMQRARRAEFKREIMHSAQVEEARRQMGDRLPFYGAMLASVGRVLVQVGSKLQSKYGGLIDNVRLAAETGYADNAATSSAARESASPAEC